MGWGLGSEPALALPGQPWLPAPGDLSGSFPTPRYFRGWRAAPRQAALSGAAVGASSVSPCPCRCIPGSAVGGPVPAPLLVPPGVCVTCGCPGGPGSLWELSHPLSSPFGGGGSFLRGLWVGGHWGGGLRQTHALACLCSTGPGDSPYPDLQPADPAAFLFAFPGAEGSAGAAQPPSRCRHATPSPPPNAWELPALALTGGSR